MTFTFRVRRNLQRSLSIFLLALALCFLPLPNLVQAAVGDLDPTFGNGGTVRMEFYPDSFEELKGMALQPDGKIIAGGTVWRGFDTYDFALARFNSNGTLDPTFGNGGKVTTHYANDDVISAVAVQSDGKIVAAGTTTNFNFTVLRYNSNGTLDLSFGNSGMIFTDFAGQEDFARAMVLQPDGKIIVAGDVLLAGTGRDFGVVRYNTDGSLDTTFGTGGKVTINFIHTDTAYAVALQPDGKIVIGGDGDGDRYGLAFETARLNSNGSLDSSFGIGGKASTIFPPISEGATALAIQSNGKIVQAGWAGGDMAFLRYKTDGTLDSTFGSGGKTLVDIGWLYTLAQSIFIQPDGKIIASGSGTTKDNEFGYFVLRLKNDGTLDPSFGSGGIAPATFSATSITRQSNGKIVTAGGYGDFGVARYLGDAIFDLCIQDESNDNIIQINSLTGEYQFMNCSGFTLGGTGTLIRRGSSLTLQHNSNDRRIMVSIDTNSNKASASVQVFSQSRTFSITDRNTLNNSCSCQ